MDIQILVGMLTMAVVLIGFDCALVYRKMTDDAGNE